MKQTNFGMYFLKLIINIPKITFQPSVVSLTVFLWVRFILVCIFVIINVVVLRFFKILLTYIVLLPKKIYTQISNRSNRSEICEVLFTLFFSIISKLVLPIHYRTNLPITSKPFSWYASSFMYTNCNSYKI